MSFWDSIFVDLGEIKSEQMGVSLCLGLSEMEWCFIE